MTGAQARARLRRLAAEALGRAHVDDLRGAGLERPAHVRKVGDGGMVEAGGEVARLARLLPDPPRSGAPPPSRPGSRRRGPRRRARRRRGTSTTPAAPRTGRRRRRRRSSCRRRCRARRIAEAKPSGRGSMCGRGESLSFTVSMSNRTAPGMWPGEYSASGSRFIAGRYQEPSTTTMSGAFRRSAEPFGRDEGIRHCHSSKVIPEAAQRLSGIHCAGGWRGSRLFASLRPGRPAPASRARRARSARGGSACPSSRCR